MSGMLDGLVTNEWRPDSALGPWVYANDVREALRSDETVWRVAAAIWWETWGELGAAPTFAGLSADEQDLPLRQAHAVLAMLAGEDQ